MPQGPQTKWRILMCCSLRVNCEAEEEASGESDINDEFEEEDLDDKVLHDALERILAKIEADDCEWLPSKEKQRLSVSKTTSSIRRQGLRPYQRIGARVYLLAEVSLRVESNRDGEPHCELA
ncbi:hypothetical protein HGRIS_004471 [Hohenbuehelia grisea]|uniref:Uncharacterized protein n=1 Tax=Hohenbuehelia grisea TaxID=104357 RepID=A0ABR3JCQ9_9AGAR